MTKMDKLERLKKIFDDLAEDHREEGESLEDAYKGSREDFYKALNDVAEDHRQEGEELENLRKEIEILKKERDDAVNNFMRPRDKDDKEDNIYGDIE